MQTCVICKTSKRRPSEAICSKTQCRQSYKEWAEQNWDQLPENSHIFKRHDREFWELNDTQKEHYARFLELVRPQRPSFKKRRCLRCREPIINTQGDWRLCAQCNIVNANQVDREYYAI